VPCSDTAIDASEACVATLLPPARSSASVRAFEHMFWSCLPLPRAVWKRAKLATLVLVTVWLAFVTYPTWRSLVRASENPPFSVTAVALVPSLGATKSELVIETVFTPTQSEGWWGSNRRVEIHIIQESPAETQRPTKALISLG
jgi:hypothetical protein